MFRCRIRLEGQGRYWIGSLSPPASDGVRSLTSVDRHAGEFAFEDNSPVDKSLCLHRLPAWSHFLRSADDNETRGRGNCTSEFDVIDTAECHELGVLLDDTRVIGRHLRSGFNHENARKDRATGQMSSAPPLVGTDVAISDENLFL